METIGKGSVVQALWAVSERLLWKGFVSVSARPSDLHAAGLHNLHAQVWVTTTSPSLKPL